MDAVFARQPRVALAVSIAGIAALLLSVVTEAPARLASPFVVIALALVLGGGVVISHHFPIHVRHDTNVYVYSVPAYLCTVLLPISFAPATILVATIVGELSVRHERGGTISDVATQASRWATLAFCASLVAHAPLAGATFDTVPLIGAAAVLWVGDILTSPLLLSPITGESPLTIISSVAREAGGPEAAQYLVGILGAVAALRALWALGILLLPIILIYRAYKSAKDVHEHTRQLLASVVETSSDGILLLDPEGVILLANRQAGALHGCDSPDELAGVHLLSLVEEGERKRVEADMQRLLAEGTVGAVEYSLLRRGGDHFAGEVSWSLIADQHGRPQALTCVARDITERKDAARHLEFQAFHDALTGLPNRMLFQDRLGQTLSLLGRDRTNCAVFLMDLNGFKAVNDTHGHQAGDVLLQHVAERLSRALRDSDTLARLGGDEFAVLLPNAEVDGAEIVARRIIAMLAEPFEVEANARRQLVNIGVSIGIALAPGHGESGDLLLERADVAMYVAKRRHSGSAYAYYDHDDVISLPAGHPAA